MKQLKGLTVAFAAAFLVLFAGDVYAATTTGQVTFIGTLFEENVGGSFNARLRVRVSGTCDSDTATKSRWVLVRSGATGGTLTHNGINMRDAYSTLLAAFLSGKNVQIDGISACSTTVDNTMNLWQGNIGMF